MTNWRPNQKLACYLLQSLFISFIAQATLIDDNMLASWGRWQWSIFWATVLLAVLNTWRAFVDQSKQRQEAETKPGEPIKL